MLKIKMKRRMPKKETIVNSEKVSVAYHGKYSFL
jgi:hypothetical protein